MGALDDSVDAFLQTLGLGYDASDFLLSLPQDIQVRVIKSFDPSGTKDGNVLGRLRAFARSMMNSPASGGRSQSAPPTLSRRAQQEAAVHDKPYTNSREWSDPEPELDESVSVYARRIGLDDAGASLLLSLPLEVRRVIMTEFDPRGTKDGNVFGRLLGFGRVIWAQRLGLDSVQAQEASSLLRPLPEEVQCRIMSQFDVSGTKDGNVMARLKRFASGVADRMGPVCQPTRAAPAANQTSRPVAHSAAPAASVPLHPVPVEAHSVDVAVEAFASRFGLDSDNTVFLQAIPDQVKEVVLTSFTVSGTKDGNVWGRLFGFIRSVWSQRMNLDARSVSFLKGLPEEAQRIVIVKFDPSRTKDGNIAARLESFARSLSQHGSGNSHLRNARTQAQDRILQDPPESSVTELQKFAQRWRLNVDASCFLESLPESVSSIVVNSFNANGTKDGNVWGRLFGFVRSIWAQRLGVDAAAFSYLRGLVEEEQIAIMVRFDPSLAPKDSGLTSLFQAIVSEALEGNTHDISGDLEYGAPDVDLLASDNEDILAFVRRCGMDQDAVDFLSGLEANVLSSVLSDFSPGGTKDGNVFARLQGFARSVQNRRKRGLDGSTGRSTRQRLDY